MTRAQSWKAWITLACVSLMFFMITAATFSSLGPALPAMMAELHWSAAEAGTGFSLLGVFCGLTSTVPAFLIRRIGTRATLVTGSIVMALAFLCLARADGVMLYFAGCALAGLGFTLLATVPGTYLLARLFARPSFAFGLYFTIGGLGGVAGPLVYLLITGIGGWRDYWLVAGAAVTLTGLVSAALVDVASNVAGAPNDDPNISPESWTARAALKTPQFSILAAAYAIFLFVGITVNTFSVTHLLTHGISTALAVSMLSLEGLFNAGARFLGGVLSRFMEARTLLLLSLGFLVMGLAALSVAHSLPMLFLYAAGIGIGYGLTFFASTILLLDYFGRGPNLELFSIVNLVSTIGSVGPAFAGLIADRTGSYVPAFAALGGLTLLVLIAAILMRPPHRSAA